MREIATTTSAAHDLSHPQFGKQAAVRLARYQRQIARREPTQGQKASAGYKRAKGVARDHDVIAVEDFKPKFLAKSTMAKKTADASIGAAKRALLAMARVRGESQDPPVAVRENIHLRSVCGAVLPRDKNSAAVMLVRAGLNPAGADRVRRAAA